ncbi:four helix bundle protein [Daejeonella sp. JGW-45]|uniref:four helix bundle protein n=1 Tax=Daejeonella sp. JGW-45 TaxID=3034148 RepID=UPI0023EE1598|nr:four helix bundle protein [Daejeonella sp. JGW-45]
MRDSLIQIKTYAFAIRIVKLYKFLCETRREFVLSKQLLRSGTAPDALSYEAEHAQSKADFLNKMNIALKEANETKFWLLLLKDSHYLTEEEFSSIIPDCSEIIQMLVSTVKTIKSSLNR